MIRIVAFLGVISSLVYTCISVNVYQCGGGDITCEPGDDCMVTAQVGDTCAEDEIVCPSGYGCDITCTGLDVCDEISIDLNDAISVNITCEGEDPCWRMSIEGTCDYLQVMCRGLDPCTFTDFGGQGLEDTQIYCLPQNVSSPVSTYGCDFSDFWPGESLNYEIHCSAYWACTGSEIAESEAARVRVACAGRGSCYNLDITAPEDGMLEITTLNDAQIQDQLFLMGDMGITASMGSEIMVTCDPQIDNLPWDSCEGMTINASDAESLQVIFGSKADIEDTSIECPLDNCEIDFSQVTTDGYVNGIEIYTENAYPEGTDISCNEGDDGYSCNNVTVFCGSGSCHFEYDESEGTYDCVGECRTGVPTMSPVPGQETTESEDDGSGSVSMHHFMCGVWLTVLLAVLLSDKY